MTRSILLSSVALISLFATSASADVTSAKSPIKEVTLSSGGLAEIKRSTTIKGTENIKIEVPLDQVNDILKSLVVFDPAGSVKDISLSGPNPLEETFKSLPFTPDDLTSLPQLLMSLKGTEIEISDIPTIKGRILGVESETQVHGRILNILNVVVADGTIRRIELKPSTEIKFSPEVAEKISAAVNVVANNVTDTARNIEVELAGKGTRNVDFTYVVAAPIWKTSYRVVIGKDGKARLQAWAVLENASGEDWNDVKISLNSSSPVTLTQRLHDRYWKQRDELPVVVDNVGIPQEDTGMQAVDKESPIMGMAAAAPAYSREMSDMSAIFENSSPPEMSYAQSATASEGDVSATFVLDDKYDIKNGDTVSVPIIDKEVAAELVSVFNPANGGVHPIAAVSLENSTGVSLPGGILTVFDENGGYVGDSSLKGLPNAETRMSSFALDKKVTITPEVNNGIKTVEIKVVDGILHSKNMNREETTYHISGASDDERNVVIEHPKRDGWEIQAPELIGESATHFRLKATLKAGESKDVKVVMMRPGEEYIQLSNLGEADLVNWAANSLDPIIREKLNVLAAAKKDEAQTLLQLEQTEIFHGALQATQERVRENLKVVPEGSEQHKSYVAKLSETEKALEENEARQAKMRDTLFKFTSRVDEIIRTF